MTAERPAGYDVHFEGTWYQYDRERRCLMPVTAATADPTRPFFSAPGEVDSDLDQGEVCDEDGHAPDAPVTDGVCGWCGEGVGQWTEVGYYTPDEGAIGPPLPVDAVEHRADGVYATVSLPGDHPAYAAVHEGLTDHLSPAPPSGENPADNGRSVNPADTRSPVHATFRAVPVPSPTVTDGLGRAEIERRRHIPPPGRIELPAALGGIPEDAPEQELVLLNRADRRARARAARKAARRGR